MSEMEPNVGGGSATDNPAEELVNEETAAKRLGKSRQWLRDLRLNGEGPMYVDMGNTVAYFPSDVDAWLLARRKAPTKVQRKKAAAKTGAKSGAKPAAKPASKPSTNQ